MLPKIAVTHGIPAMESEIGGHGTSTSENVHFMQARIAALMRHLGMCGHEEAQILHRAPTHRHAMIAAPDAGVFRTLVEVGQRVRIGQLLGRVDDLQGRILHEITAPKDGMVLARRAYLSVAGGDNLFVLLIER
jgi:hypothetical protein